MDILNWLYLAKNKFVRTTIDNPKDLMIFGAKVGVNKRGDVYQNYAMEINDFAATLPAGPTGPQGVAGVAGPAGAPGPVGPAGLNWQGAWSALGTYVIDDAVGYGGASWFCIANVGPSATTPDTDPTNWALLASQGATGATGATGLQGPTGAAGPSNVLSIGSVTTLSAGSSATATITGSSPIQTLNLGIPQGAAGASTYVKYVAQLTQTGTSAPTAVVLENTTTGSWVYSYSGVTGVYYIQNTNYSATLPTKILVLLGKDATNMGIFECSAIGAGQFQIRTAFGGGSLQNGVINGSSIEIRIYP